ncbi:MAG: type III pantothenate kinase, partial [Clostridia bacterium]|nr:type III pantothenate kinase [Clostridia bacterium]
MILAIDVGNTNIVVGVLDGRKVLSSARISTNSCGAAYEFAFQVKGALEFNNVDIENLEGAAISSVVPSITTILKDAMAMLKVKKTIVVEAGVKTGLNIKIDDPAQLGADLVAGAVAALTMAKPPMVVIDMGTATTLSAIDKNGVFKGVVIAPGVNLALGALVGGASMLPEVPL